MKHPSFFKTANFALALFLLLPFGLVAYDYWKNEARPSYVESADVVYIIFAVFLIIYVFALVLSWLYVGVNKKEALFNLALGLFLIFGAWLIMYAAQLAIGYPIIAGTDWVPLPPPDGISSSSLINILTYIILPISIIVASAIPYRIYEMNFGQRRNFVKNLILSGLLAFVFSFAFLTNWGVLVDEYYLDRPPDSSSVPVAVFLFPLLYLFSVAVYKSRNKKAPYRQQRSAKKREFHNPVLKFFKKHETGIMLTVGVVVALLLLNMIYLEFWPY